MARAIPAAARVVAMWPGLPALTLVVAPKSRDETNTQQAAPSLNQANVLVAECLATVGTFEGGDR